MFRAFRLRLDLLVAQAESEVRNLEIWHPRERESYGGAGGALQPNLEECLGKLNRLNSKEKSLQVPGKSRGVAQSSTRTLQELAGDAWRSFKGFLFRFHL